MSWPRRLVAAGLFPITLVGCVWLAWAATAAGWPPIVTLAAPLPAALICVLGERFQPHLASWRPARHDVVLDVLHTGVSQYGGGYLAGLAVQGLVLVVAASPITSVWPTALPIAAQVALALLASELVHYGWHYASHSRPSLWRLHAMHHSSSGLYWLAGARFHPIEVMLTQVASFAPLAILGVPAEVLALASVISNVTGMFQHSNIELRLGPLNWLFSGPELHRWHHSTELGDQKRNLGGTIVVWDVVFGTRRAPSSSEPSPQTLGLTEPFPRTYAGHLLAPVRWNRP